MDRKIRENGRESGPGGGHFAVANGIERSALHYATHVHYKSQLSRVGVPMMRSPCKRSAVTSTN